MFRFSYHNVMDYTRYSPRPAYFWTVYSFGPGNFATFGMGLPGMGLGCKVNTFGGGYL